MTDAPVRPRKLSPDTLIRPGQATVDSCGQKFKVLVVELTGSQTVDGLRASPSAFKLIQPDRTLTLHRGDTVHVVAADGGSIAQGLCVIRALGHEIWLGKPLRIVKLEQDILYEDASHTVVPQGAGYSIRHNRTEVVEDRVFHSVDAAKSELARRAPVVSAGGVI